MAIIKKKDIRKMSDDELKKKLAELRTELFREQGVSKVGGTLKSPGKIKQARKTIARILTILGERKKK